MANRLRNSAYPVEEKRTALDLYEKLGLCEAARRTGISQPTIYKWASRAGLKPPQTFNHEAIKAFRESRSVIKERLANRLLDYAETELDRLYKPLTYKAASNKELVTWELPEPMPADRKQIMLTAAIAIDKSALLAGEATGRTEHLDVKELDAALNEAIPDPDARRKLALRVLRGRGGEAEQ